MSTCIIKSDDRRVIYFGWIDAYNAGEKRHPVDVVTELGMNVYLYHSASVGDCSFLEVDNIPETLPNYIKLSDFKFNP